MISFETEVDIIACHQLLNNNNNNNNNVGCHNIMVVHKYGSNCVIMF